MKLQCSTTEPQRLCGEGDLLRSSCMTLILHTVRISNVNSVMFVNRIRSVSFRAWDQSTNFISAYPFVDCYLYLTKILHLVDTPCNVIKMEIVSYPRGKVRRCFQGVLITASYNEGTSFFYLFIHFYVTLEKRPLITKGDFSNHRSSESQI